MERLSTGRTGLDLVLGGGLPRGALIVIAGPPGSGKTILAQQICFANATPERKALYYTTWSEPHDKLVRHLASFPFFEPEAIGGRIEFLSLGDLLGDMTAASDEILRRSFASKPALVVIDSSRALHEVLEPAQVRRTVYDLASKVAHTNAVLLLVGEYAPADVRELPEFAVADGILQLENEPYGPIDRRWLRVLKMRGTAFSAGRHSFRLSADGFEIFPRLEATLPRQIPVLKARAAFGDPRLDAALAGGIPQGDTSLLLGPTGVGKTFLAVHFAAAGIEAGERALILSFQETADQLHDKAATAGFDWSGLRDEQLSILHIPPVEVDLDHVGAMIRAEIARAPVGRLIVDSVAELAFAARDTDRLPAYLWALGGFIRAGGGTTLFTNEIAALGQTPDLSRLSFLFDNVMLLRYIEVESQLLRALNVLKMRQSGHSKQLLRFTIDGGIRFGDPIEDVSGLLGWTALRSDPDAATA